MVAAPSYEGKRKKQIGGPKGKRRKLEPLVGEEQGHDTWEDWLVKEGEMRSTANWLKSKEDPIPNMKLKQMELNFKKVLGIDNMKDVAVKVDNDIETIHVPVTEDVEQGVNITPKSAGQEVNITPISEEQEVNIKPVPMTVGKHNS